MVEKKFKPEEVDESGVPYPDCKILPLKEFNLSDEECYDAVGRFYYYKGISIKEFIKLCQEDLFVPKGKTELQAFIERMNKLAGSKLINDIPSTKSEIQDYDKEHDIMSIHWGKNTKHSAEFFDGQLVLDFDNDNNIVGLEMFDFMKEVKKSQVRLDKIFGNQEQDAPCRNCGQPKIKHFVRLEKEGANIDWCYDGKGKYTPYLEQDKSAPEEEKG